MNIESYATFAIKKKSKSPKSVTLTGSQLVSSVTLSYCLFRNLHKLCSVRIVEGGCGCRYGRGMKGCWVLGLAHTRWAGGRHVLLGLSRNIIIPEYCSVMFIGRLRKYVAFIVVIDNN